jgi:Protein of unknown function (DUF2815)
MATSSVKVERSARVVTPVGRASYPTVFQAKAFNETAEPKYSCAVLIPKSDPFGETVKRLQNEALELLYGKKLPQNLERWGITDGDDEPEGSPARGCWVIKASSKMRPAVVDVTKQPVIDAEEVYGGCDVRLSICAKAYGSATKGGVSLELVAVQKMGDNTPFGGAEAARAAAVAEF